MARIKLPERSFVFEKEDGSEILGYPLALAHWREFMRDGTFDCLDNPKAHKPEEVYEAGTRILVAALRKDADEVARLVTPEQAGVIVAAVLRESSPQPEEGDPKPQSP